MSEWGNGDTGSPDPIRKAIQDVLDKCDDGWTVSHYLVVMGLERVQGGAIEQVPWLFPAPGQPHWVTEGLLRTGDQIQYSYVEEDTD